MVKFYGSKNGNQDIYAPLSGSTEIEMTTSNINKQESLQIDIV